ncbi:UDP-N-acetylmuramoyl-tripeptide--D-alanyl-D-alanine ligase [Thermodesulfovibrio sp.]|uniref:UDP-N-acetylmuramoyl-tripeptide--D-alanyl-D- alanine ligase n=1 Tax=Thermodesulfovibrio sp. TaxID=2067987 RepID=UPI0030A80911
MFTLEDLVNATGGQILSKGDELFSSASIDTRTIGSSDIFFALKGTKRDGHEFVGEALSKSSGAVISKAVDIDFSGKTVVRVQDTSEALRSLGRYIRAKFKGSVIAVLGSNGKTTTKELISGFLGKKYNILKTEGNLNNNIGVPLSLSKYRENTEIMVLELGTNRKGDIKELCEIVYPQYAVITNIGYEHLEGFGSLEGVREGELEVLQYAKTVFVNGDDKFLMEGLKSWQGKIITFGLKNEFDYYADEVEFHESGTDFVFNSQLARFPLKTNLIGLHNLYNITAACAVAVHFGISKCMIKETLKNFEPVKMRGEIFKIDDREIFFDAYNANPSSVRAALLELSRRKKDRIAVAVLGDMLELGEYTEKAHEEIGLWLRELKIEQFIGVGKFIGNALRYVDGHVFANAEAAGNFLRENLKGNEVVLIKGSRAVRMEKILEILMKGQRE